MKALHYLATIIFVAFSLALASDEQMPTKAKLEAAMLKQRERLERLKPVVEPLMIHDLETLQFAVRQKVLQLFSGASIIANSDRPKFLGIISSTLDGDSIFNSLGSFGSQFSVDSIWNKFGEYGSPHSLQSPFNPYSSDPPTIVKDRKIIGYLTKNKYLEGAVDPDWLKTFFD
jgi:hypothetical protein